MTASFLFLAALLSLAAVVPILVPLVRTRFEDENTRLLRRQRAALDAARDAGVLSDQEYAEKRAALPESTASPRPARGLAIGLAVALPLSSLALYREIGEPRALDPNAWASSATELAAVPDLETAVARLEQRLAGASNDIESLRLLSRYYQRLQRFDEARDVLAKVRALAPDDLDIQVEFAEALALANPTRRFEGEALVLLDDALARNPNHQRALWLAGIAALQRDDRATAVSYWQRLLPLLPPNSNVAEAVALHIRELGGDPAVSANEKKPPKAETDQAIEVTVRIADALRAQVAPTDTVFVFARAADGPRMPLAIQRFAASELPKRVTLDDTMGMMPSLRLSQVPRIILGARISKTGNAMPQPGDLETISAPIDRTRPVPRQELVIDTVVTTAQEPRKPASQSSP